MYHLPTISAADVALMASSAAETFLTRQSNTPQLSNSKFRVNLWARTRIIFQPYSRNWRRKITIKNGKSLLLILYNATWERGVALQWQLKKCQLVTDANNTVVLILLKVINLPLPWYVSHTASKQAYLIYDAIFMLIFRRVLALTPVPADEYEM